jgi:hypothetical protein
MSTFTVIQCGECGGQYECVGTLRYRSNCGHEVTAHDITPNLDEGETLACVSGVLGYVSGGVWA